MKTIFFDWGGVVADDSGDDFLTQVLINIGANKEQIREIFKSYMADFMRGKITEEEYWRLLQNKYGFAISDTITDEFKKWSGLRANQDILALVDEVRAAGWQAAILSNVIRPSYFVLKDAGFYDRFDGVIASCEEGYAKPELEMYRIALERMHATAKESVFVDDKQRNLDPAEVMGFKVILAENPAQIIRDVQALVA